MGCGRAAFNSLFRRPTVLYRQSVNPLRIGIEHRTRCPTGPSARAISGYSPWLAAKFGTGQTLPGINQPARTAARLQRTLGSHAITHFHESK